MSHKRGGGASPRSSSKAPRMTAQMLTLGLDACDNDTTAPVDGDHSASTTTTYNSDPKNGTSRQAWWKNMKGRLEGYSKTDASGDDALTSSNENGNSKFYCAMDRPSDEEAPTLSSSLVEMEAAHSFRAASAELGAQYAVLEEVQQKRSQRRLGRQLQNIHSEASHESFLHKQQRSDQTDTLKISLKEQQQPQSREEALQRDCNFFYRDMDDVEIQRIKKNNRRSWRAMVRDNNNCGIAGISQPSFEYSQAITVLTPPVLQRFHTRFEQLNQDIPISRTANHRLSHHDLQLTTTFTSDDRIHQDRILQTDAVETSSLFFHLADNKTVIMRLPRDQVRLLMDQDLEPGMLAVEQWRNEPADFASHDSSSSSTGVVDSGEAFHTRPDRRLQRSQQSFKERHPALRYVLTVNDDLYRKMMSELSDKMTEPFFSTRRCCQEDEKVDIRVAVILLAIVLLILFATTIERPGE